MSDKRLPKEHELQVLKKLSTDDAYRAQFESDPAGALKAAGVPDEAITALDPESLKPGKLADKSVIADTHGKVDSENLNLHACMIFPVMRVDYGNAGGAKSS